MAHASSFRSWSADFLRRSRFRELGASTIIFALILLAGALALLFREAANLRSDFQDVLRSNAVLVQIAEAHANVVGCEMTVRGYALTSDPQFLKYQSEQRVLLTVAMANLAELTKNNPPRAAQLRRMSALVEQRLALYKSLTALGPGHAKEVAAAITDPEKRKEMFDVHVGFDNMRDDELGRLADREAAYASQMSRTLTTATVLIVLACLIGFLGARLHAAYHWRRED